MSKLIPNHSTKIAKETTISFIGMGFGDMVRYLFTGVLARLVGVEFLGVFSLANSITRIGEVFGRAGLHTGVMRFVSRLDQQEEAFEIKQKVRSALMFGLIFSITVMILLFSLADWLTDEVFHGSELLKTVIIICAFSLPFATTMTIAAFSTQGFKLLKYKVTVLNIVSPLIILLSVLLCVIFLNKEAAIKYPLLISSVISATVGIYFLQKLTGLHLNEMFRGILDWELLKFSYPLMFVTVIGTLMHWMDIMMLGYFTDTSTVGLYHPAARTAGLLRTVLMAFLGIFSPMMSEYHRKGKIGEMNHLYKLIVRWIVSLSLPLAIIMILFSKKFMLLFGGQFISSASVLSVLTFSAFIQSFVGSSASTLSMIGYPRINLINSTIALVVNVILNLLWIPLYGIIGAAFATLISITLLAFLRLTEVRYFIRIHPFSLKLLKPFIAGTIMAFVLYFLKQVLIPLHTILTLSLTFIIGLVIYFIMLWILKFDKDDKEIWSGIVMIFNNKGNS